MAAQLRVNTSETSCLHPIDEDVKNHYDGIIVGRHLWHSIPLRATKRDRLTGDGFGQCWANTVGPLRGARYGVPKSENHQESFGEFAQCRRQSVCEGASCRDSDNIGTQSDSVRGRTRVRESWRIVKSYSTDQTVIFVGFFIIAVQRRPSAVCTVLVLSFRICVLYHMRVS